MEDIRQKIEKAKRDEDCFAELVREYEKHILYAAYRTVGHYVSKSDDEWSVAMMAFYEAVRSYDAEKGSFVKFSEMVIRRRVIDQLQHHGKYRPEVTADIEEEFSNEPAPEPSGTDNPVRDEIEAFSGLLEEYGLVFRDLAKSSPKSRKTKHSCALAVQALLEHPELARQMRSRRTLPMKQIEEISGVPRKILDRHRKYIIAAAEILLGDYPHLQEYVRYIRGGRI